jgi:hypothetical protein
MSTLSNFQSSNLLRFDNGFTYRVDHPFGSYNDRTDINFFVEKTPDMLGFELDLGTINGLLSGMSIYFEGTADESTNTISWTIDNERLSRRETNPQGKSLFGFTITSVSGQLSTSIQDITPTIDTGNDGTDRLYRTSMTLLGDHNTIHIAAGPVISATIFIDNTTARCGNKVPAFRFDINVGNNNSHEDGCGNKYLLVNEPVRFTADILNVRSLGMPASTTYTWQVFRQNESGGWDMPETHGPTDSRHFNYSPYQTRVLKIKVIVDVTTDATYAMENGIGTHEFQISVYNHEMLLLSGAVCRLRQNNLGFYSILVRGTRAGGSIANSRFRIIDPLWDPTPDQLKENSLSPRPFTLQELQQMRRNMERNIKLASEIESLTANLIQIYEKYTHAAIAKQLDGINDKKYDKPIK